MALTPELEARIQEDCEELMTIRAHVSSALGKNTIAFRLSEEFVNNATLMLYQIYYMEDQQVGPIPLPGQEENTEFDEKLGPILKVSPEIENMVEFMVSRRKKAQDDKATDPTPRRSDPTD